MKPRSWCGRSPGSSRGREAAAVDRSFSVADISILLDCGGDVSTDLRASVQDTYGKAARRAMAGAKATCCGGESPCAGPITSDLYSDADTAGLPMEAVLASLGCGNPGALADLQ